MRKISIIFAAIIILGGCAKKTTELVTPDSALEPNLTIEEGRMDLDKQPDPVMSEATKDNPQPETSAAPKSSDQPQKQAGKPKNTAATNSRSTLPVSSNPTTTTVSGDKAASALSAQQGEEASQSGEGSVPLLDSPRKMEYAQEVLFPDSAWDKYMIQKGDFLIKIAKQEYNDWTMWRDIYRWNRETIGDDPNKIYPYHWLDLLKPYDEVEACKLTFFPRETREGESLWTIAREVYGDEYAWIVLFWDNEELLESNNGVLYPGLTLQIRESIDPCESKS